MDWLNDPPEWSEDRGVLAVVTGAKTDFWRETHYGFIRDDGHFRHVMARATSARRWRFAATIASSTTRPG